MGITSGTLAFIKPFKCVSSHRAHAQTPEHELMSGGNDTSKSPIRSVRLRWRTQFFCTSDGLDKGDYCSAELLTALLRFSGWFAVGEFLAFLCVCCTDVPLFRPSSTPDPCPRASTTILLHSSREWRVFALLMDEGLLFTHGVVWKAGMDRVIMHHISGRCSGNVSLRTGCLCRRTPCWTPAWNRGSFANVARVCWRGRLGNPCNSPWRDSRSLGPPGTDQLQYVETWRISLDLEMDSYLNVCGLWTETPLENGEH